MVDLLRDNCDEEPIIRSSARHLRSDGADTQRPLSETAVDARLFFAYHTPIPVEAASSGPRRPEGVPGRFSTTFKNERLHRNNTLYNHLRHEYLMS